MESVPDHLLRDHISHLDRLWGDALVHSGYDAAWVNAGVQQMHFRDDHGPKFKPAAYLAQWVDPAYITPGSRLWVQPGSEPVLFLLQEEDYWHAPADFPEYLAPVLEIRTFPDLDKLNQACLEHARRCSGLIASAGPPEVGAGDNQSDPHTNPPGLFYYLDYHRAQKSELELLHMRTASNVGAAGHVAASRAFREGGSEFDIHTAYLAASGQNETDLPYGNIVALNEHGAILHYQFQERAAPAQHRSLLIDAGGCCAGYASDITRTYTAEGSEHATFSELLAAMQIHQSQLIDSIQPGRSFADLHAQMHEQLAELLVSHKLIECSAEAALNDGITRAFCPHGLGHLLGVQVHDAGGHLADVDGTPAPPPEVDGTLRFTRTIEAGQVFTIEPGLYFMPYFIRQLKQDNAPVAWKNVELLVKYGGIRIEDNVLVKPEGTENLTRNAFDSLHG